MQRILLIDVDYISGQKFFQIKITGFILRTCRSSRGVKRNNILNHIYHLHF